MTPTPTPAPAGRPRSGELTEAECVERLAGAHVGRIAWRCGDGLELLPVSYAWYRGDAVFRTSAYGGLADLVRPTEAVFEVDDLDSGRRSGWSVVIRGTTVGVDEPIELVQLWTVDGLTPWADGVRNLFVRLHPRRITGRWFAAAPP